MIQPVRKTSNHLLVSEDKGEIWQYSDWLLPMIVLHSMKLPFMKHRRGDIVGFLRTTLYDHACIARSTDGGKTFEWKSMQFQGHPLAALRLPG